MSLIRSVYAGLSIFCALFIVIIYKWEASVRIDHPATDAVSRKTQPPSTNDFVTSKLSTNYTLMKEIAALLMIDSTDRTPVVDHRSRSQLFDRCDMNRPSNYSGLIVVDWTYKSDAFSFINYKSFESLLQVYPHSEVHVHLIAPVTANYYKIGDFLSKHQLQKYIKMGYNIQIKVLCDSLKRHGGAVDSSRAATPPMGSDYWDAEMYKCCQHRRAADIARKRPMVPLHLYFYRRFLSLYESGGIYSDFAWYHIRALDVASSLDAAALQPSHILDPSPVVDKDSLMEIVHEQMNSSAGVEAEGGVNGAIVQLHCGDASSEDGERGSCSSSSLMAFSRHSPVLRCMLLQFSFKTSSLLQCLQLQSISRSNESAHSGEYMNGSSSSVPREVKCITESLGQCFQSSNLSNAFLRLRPTSSGPAVTNSGVDGHGDLRREEAPIVFGCNKEFLLGDAVVDVIHYDHRLVSEQLELSSVANMGDVCASTSSTASPTGKSLYDELLWNHSDTQLYRARSAFDSELYYCSCNATLCSEFNYLHSTKAAAVIRAQSDLYSAIWLGSRATDGSWSIPAPDSLLSHYLNSSVPLVSRAPESSLHRRFESSKSLCVRTGQYCRRSELERLMQQYRYHLKRSQIKVLGRTKRAEYEYYRFANQYNGTITYNELYHSRSRSPFVNLSCRNFQMTDRLTPPQARQALLSCGPSFVLPGFMKAGTTYLFGVLTRHPHVLNALRGVGFKETGCYLPSSRRDNRMNCFPFVEPSDHMYFGDGTVWYMFRSDVQQLLLADNPSIKLVVCIRNPVERTISHHRFYYKQLSYKNGTVQDINDILSILFDRSEGNIMDWHDLAWAIVREQDAEKRALLVHSLQSSVFAGLKPRKQKRYKVYGQMIVHSLYFPAIHHWYSKIPSDNLLVIPVDTLNTGRITLDVKMEFIRNFTGTGDPRLSRDRETLTSTRDIDNLYLLYQYNRIFR